MQKDMKKSSSEDVLVVIPAYNEELTIGSVVLLSRKYGSVLVVDDGSSDRTSEVSSKAGAIVIRHEKNLGKGRALKTAFEYALAEGFKVVVTMDADGQHNPDEIPLLLEPILRGRADIVIGSRYIKKETKRSIPLYRRLGLWVLNKGTKIATEMEVDSQSGFRAYTIDVLRKVPFDGDGYSAETDIIAKAKDLGFRITEVPVNVRYDVPNKHKKHPIVHGFSVLASVVGLIGYRRPLLLFGTLSLLFFVLSALFAYWGLKPYYTSGHIFLTQTIAAGVFLIIAIQLLIAGLTLNVLGKMVRE